MILVIADPRFVLMEECPPFHTQNASQSVRDAYGHWTKANDKACLYILASMSDILSKKHEIMVTARQIMDSLREMFEQPSIQIKQEAIKYIYNARMIEGQSVREHVLDMIVNFNIEGVQRISLNNNTYLRHLRLGHINLDRIERLVKNGLLNELEDDSLPPYESCLEGKEKKVIEQKSF
ncbi:gag/pol protein [Cucumis melo var. makuwa]|uniref:Gag/pol protein n=1 Tax=Cucumis melo var. makuwa TaxID=1194695 RepID=A0A5D3BF29_CUCMM|nr:gag/pol protein [Cucumis melo var. makuwa]TYJ97649.1 gag/pol protein [Cucumis melo var. makuwa]